MLPYAKTFCESIGLKIRPDFPNFRFSQELKISLFSRLQVLYFHPKDGLPKGVCADCQAALANSYSNARKIHQGNGNTCTSISISHESPDPNPNLTRHIFMQCLTMMDSYITLKIMVRLGCARYAIRCPTDPVGAQGEVFERDGADNRHFACQ